MKPLQTKTFLWKISSGISYLPVNSKMFVKIVIKLFTNK